MDTGISIQGGKPDKQAVEAITDSVVRIFKQGQKTNMDQKTIRRAVDIVEAMGVVKEVSISGCTVMGDQPAPRPCEDTPPKYPCDY